MFVIVSGFVIFLLLDRKMEAYGEFICRRFFRLYPAFIVLFGLSIPLSFVWKWDLQHSPYLSTVWQSRFLDEFHRAWQHWQWNVLWHFPMLHGVAPDAECSKCTDIAFLGQAWSISLEWQFYLVAPLAYLAATSSRPLHRIGACVLCIYLFLGKGILPDGLYRGYSSHGAFLPFHIEYFFIGAVSYFAFKKARCDRADIIFPISVSVAILLWHPDGLIPICLWIAFLGLLLEPQGSYSRRFLSIPFSHPIPQFLGKISYSIYLSHILVMNVAQYFLLKGAPSLSRPNYFWTLLGITALGTVIASMVLYRFVEMPGIRWGQKVACVFRKRSSSVIEPN